MWVGSYLSQGGETLAYSTVSVETIDWLGIVELVCMGAILVVVCFLPKIYEVKGEREE